MNSACLLIIKLMTWSKHLFCLTYSFLCLNQFSKSYPFLFQCCEISPRVYLMWGFCWRHSLWDISSFSSQLLSSIMFINLPSLSSSGCIYAALWVWVWECPELSIADVLEFLKKCRDQRGGVRGDRAEVTYKCKRLVFRGWVFLPPTQLCRALPVHGPDKMLEQLHPVFTNGKHLLGCEFTTFHLVSLAGDWYSWRNKVEKIFHQPPKIFVKVEDKTVLLLNKHLTSMWCGSQAIG